MPTQEMRLVNLKRDSRNMNTLQFICEKCKYTAWRLETHHTSIPCPRCNPGGEVIVGDEFPLVIGSNKGLATVLGITNGGYTVNVTKCIGVVSLNKKFGLAC